MALLPVDVVNFKLEFDGNETARLLTLYLARKRKKRNGPLSFAAYLAPLAFHSTDMVAALDGPCTIYRILLRRRCC